MRTLAAAAMASLLVGVAGCASGGVVEEDLNAPQACVRIDNTEGGRLLGRVFLVNIDSRERIRVGEVPMGSQVRQCFRRATFSGPWYLSVEQRETRVGVLRDLQIQADNSEIFYVRPGDEIVWNVRLNRITVEQIGGQRLDPDFP